MDTKEGKRLLERVAELTTHLTADDTAAVAGAFMDVAGVDRQSVSAFMQKPAPTDREEFMAQLESVLEELDG